MMTHMTSRATVGSEKEIFLYEAAFRMTFLMDGREAGAAFERLFALSGDRPDLRDARDRSVSCEIPEGSFSRPVQDKNEPSLDSLIEQFEKHAETIRSGTNLHWLSWAAQIYLGLFSDCDRTISPRERLHRVLGEANAKNAVEGFIGALFRSDLPSLSDVIGLAVTHQIYNWWYALAAGLIERWELKLDLATFSDEFLKAMGVFDLANPVFEQADGHSRVVAVNWKTALKEDRPELVRDAYVAIARAKLARGEQNIEGLRELISEDVFETYRGGVALQLLREFPNCERFRLAELFDGIFGAPRLTTRFLDTADQVIAGATPVGQVQYDAWLAAAYMLAPNRFEAKVEDIAVQRPQVVFELRDRSGFDSPGDRHRRTLTLPQLEFLARLAGIHYPETAETAPPKGGWWGSANAWDAVEFCRKLIDTISSMPSQAASEALKRLEADPEMASYDPHLRHALANQASRRRETEYDRPNWSSTIKALSNGRPATVADLHALLMDQLGDLRQRIARENTDIFKSFWNLDGRSRILEPRPEEACRDTLITLLRPALAPKEVTVEPEGHMVADKRADISAAMPGRKILCELKRDYHRDLWTAAEQQLERFYVHDPEAKGFGIYGVFWFGEKRPSPMPRHPGALGPAKSAAELEQMLRDRIPADKRHRIAVTVIDVIRSARLTDSDPDRIDHARSMATCQLSVIGSVRPGSLFLTLPTRALTGQATISSEG